MSEANAKQAARAVALEILIETERSAYANLALKKRLQNSTLSREDVRFTGALVYTTLENLIYLDFIIDSFAKSKIQAVVRCILRLGVCQLLLMGVPESAACNESVKLAKNKRKPHGFVNGVLRSVARAQNSHTLPEPAGSPAQILSIKNSWPLWIVQMWIAQLEFEKAKALIEYRAGNNSTIIRANVFKSDTQTIKESLTAANAHFEMGKYCAEAIVLRSIDDIASNDLYTSGKITIQSESSMLVAHACKVKTGMRVLDACAAPGGKSMHLAGIMQSGEILAWDKHEHRVALIKKNYERLGIPFIQAQTQDATQFRQELAEGFDLVLLDVPCSGLGVMSKPDVKYTKSPEQINTLVAMQQEILQTCARYVKKGGALVYSTCTISQEENQNNMAWFLQENQNFSKDDICFLFEGKESQPEIFEGFSTQLLPNTDEAEGFYIARMVKN